MKFSPAGIFVVTIGLVAGIMIWVVGYFNLPNKETHRNLAANPPIETSTNATASTTPTATGSSSTQPPASSSSGATSASGDVQKGQVIFAQQCAVCHGTNGVGGTAPAITGSQSILPSSNMTQLSALVSFVKANMPLTSPGSLSQQQATDVSAFVLSLK
ncbi:MAG: hypothetical protein A2201_00695 [Alicyclobacillus sp. RIFOXYA1_FULL_53_8]|nr:MAG: hypothetical protein A2201_00695 [Alicyclobacillus sp. RIFOXYA1_FULL_53_8]